MGNPQNFVLEFPTLKRTTKLRHIRRPLKKNRRVLMKRRKSSIPRRNQNGGIEKRVKTLKKLIPTRESQGLDGLFRDTAAYIISLQMKVRVMQIMVDALGTSSQDYHE